MFDSSHANKNDLKNMTELVQAMVRMKYAFEIDCSDPGAPPGAQGTLYMLSSMTAPNTGPSLMGVFRPRVSAPAAVTSNLVESLIAGE